MKIYSNYPISDKLKWKGNQILVSINKKKNVIITEDDEGRRFEADSTITPTDNPEDIIKSVNRMFNDIELDDDVIYGFFPNIIGEILPNTSIISNVEVLFDESFLIQKEVIKALNNEADANIKKLVGNIKNYVIDLTDSVRSFITDSDIENLINNNNIIITTDEKS